jgi:hypothetical protein
MRALARLESFIQDLVERPAWLLTPRRLHPIEMAAALTRALESNALPLADRVLVPDGYALRLHPDDFAPFVSVRRILEREFADYLTRLTEERGLTMNLPASVILVESRAVRFGAIEVTTRFNENLPPSSTIYGRITRPSPTTATVTPPPRRESRSSGPAMIEVLDERGGVIRRHPLGGAGLVIGRRSGSGLMLPDPEISRRHAQIEPDSGQYVIRDLDSMNGTAVNGHRITGIHPLRDGDVIEVGHSRLRFRLGGG